MSSGYGLSHVLIWLLLSMFCNGVSYIFTGIQTSVSDNYNESENVIIFVTASHAQQKSHMKFALLGI